MEAHRRTTVAATLVFCLTAGAVAAADEERGRIALLLTYKCRPENRPAFRDHLRGAGLAQLESWRSGGAFTDHLLLFNVDVEQEAWDALLLLRFESWAQYARWKDTEQQFPAALAPAALNLTSSISSSVAELSWHGTRPKADPAAKPVYFVRPYFFTDRNLYRKFYEAYNAPQLEAWLRTGAITSYRVVMNQNPSGGTWGVMFLYEYPSWEAANARADVKDAVGPELRALPAWELLGETKGGIRTSGRVTLAERLQAHSAPR